MKRESSGRARLGKRARNGAAGLRHGVKETQEQVKEEPDAEREERVSQRDLILNETPDLEKLQAELLAERAESAAARKILIEHSTNLMVVQGELATEKRKRILRQEIVDKQTEDLIEFRETFSAEAENFKDLEKRALELESELQKIQFNLRTAKARATCFFCDAPRNALCIPCLHLYYCMKCQENYTQNDKKCRFCETVIAGVLECYQ